MGDQPDITVDSAPGMATEDLMERHLRIVSRIKELKKLKAVIDEELTGRLRQETGHRLTFGDVEFKAGAGYRIVSDREGLIRYLGDDWSDVIPIDRPRITGLRRIARRRGEDPALVVSSFLAWKNSNRIAVKHNRRN